MGMKAKAKRSNKKTPVINWGFIKRCSEGSLESYNSTSEDRKSISVDDFSP